MDEQAKYDAGSNSISGCAVAVNKKPEVYDLCETIMKQIDVIRAKLEPVICSREVPKNVEERPQMSQIVYILLGIKESLIQLDEDICL